MFLKNLFKVTKDHILLFNLYATFRKDKSIQTKKKKAEQWLPRVGGEGHMGSDNRSL